MAAYVISPFLRIRFYRYICYCWGFFNYLMIIWHVRPHFISIYIGRSEKGMPRLMQKVRLLRLQIQKARIHESQTNQFKINSRKDRNDLIISNLVFEFKWPRGQSKHKFRTYYLVYGNSRLFKMLLSHLGRRISLLKILILRYPCFSSFWGQYYKKNSS